MMGKSYTNDVMQLLPPNGSLSQPICLRERQDKTFLGDEKLSGIRVSESPNELGEDILLDGVFIEIGMTPNSEPLRGLFELNDQGEVPVERDMSTAFPGLFSAGDVIDGKEKQIAIAVGQGAQAALSAYEYLHSRGFAKTSDKIREAWQ